MTTPVDQTVRDAASRDLGTSFFLEAGAGTGKTRILVDRVIEIMRTGAALIQEVVVITFTEKAAGELRSRIREELHKGVTAADEDERLRFRAALRGLDSAHIETIHAFASSLLREHPLEAGVDPNFQQLDEVGNELDFQERWNDWIWSIEGPDLAAVERCLILGMALATVREVARILERLRELSLSEMRRGAPDPAEVVSDLRDVVTSGEALTGYCQKEDDNCLKTFAELRRQVAVCDGLAGAALERALRSIRFRSLKGDRRNWFPRERRDELLAIIGRGVEQLQHYREALNEEALGDLAQALRGFVQEAARSRKREGKLNFEDLLIEARAFVAEHPSVRQALQRRLRFILVDEFQDTDPLQADLVFLLSADEARAPLKEPVEWTKVTLAPGKLFLVGDPKQSIYRFRRADIDTYSAARRVFARHEEAGEPARLETIVQNFRSVPQVTGWVNATFENVIRSDASFPNAQPDYSAIESYREGTPGPRVVVMYPSVDVGQLLLPQLRREEAETVAGLITNLVDSDEWLISDPDEDWRERPRKVAFRDICILVDTRTAIDLYTTALTNKNIPFILDGGREFFQRQEVRDLAAILRALDDVSDEVSLVAALKSEAFACSDVELLEYRRGGGRFSLFSKQGGGPVASAIAQLRALYNEKAHLSLPAFVDRVIRESFLVEPLLLRPGDRQRAANLKMIVERAVEFAANEVDSLRPFIRWLSERQMEGTRETESQVAETDDNVVRIMTVHGAKGLEFPVVILAKLSSGVWGDREKRVVDRELGVIEFEVGKEENRFRTPGFEAAAAREEAYEEAQDARLMYVATTRARDLLVVPVFKSEERPGKFAYLPGLPSWTRAVQPSYDDEPNGARVLLQAAIKERTIEVPPGPRFGAEVSAAWHDRATRLAERKTAGPRFIAPSMLVADEVKEPRETEPKDRSEDERDRDVQDDTDRALGTAEGAAGVAFVGSSSARQRGSLVHEVLYRCDLADPASAAEWARTLCAQRGLPELAPQIEEHAKRVLEGAPMQRVRQAQRLLRELPVAWFDAATDSYIEGFVDFAFEEHDGWVIVDYKTDAVDGKTATLAARYRPQLDAYRQALGAAGVTVKEAGLWFSATGELVVT